MIANPQQELLPGMFVRARIAKGQRPDAILVPAASVSRNSKGQATVMLVNKQAAVEGRVIETGQTLGDQVLVTEGLAAGDQLIVAGLQKIKPGVPVKAVAPPSPAPASVAKGE
jgi:membrane fusion protein (multidrug efflux system)